MKTGQNKFHDTPLIERFPLIVISHKSLLTKTMKTKKQMVAIYAGASTDKQKVDMQLNELRTFINRSGWKVYKEVIDEGYTGSNTKLV